MANCIGSIRVKVIMGKLAQAEVNNVTLSCFVKPSLKVSWYNRIFSLAKICFKGIQFTFQNKPTT